MIYYISSWIHHYRQKSKNIHPMTCQERLQAWGGKWNEHYAGKFINVYLHRTGDSGFEFNGYVIGYHKICSPDGFYKKRTTLYLADNGRFIVAGIVERPFRADYDSVHIINDDRALVGFLGWTRAGMSLYQSLRYRLRSDYFPSYKATKTYP